MPRGANAKREREYNELKKEFKKEGRYKGRQEEVAARIVNKQRARFGETKAEKRKDREGKSPDRGLPIKNYQHKTIDQVKRALPKLSPKEVKEIERYEKQHKNRKTLLEEIHAHTGGKHSSGRDGHSGSKRSSSSRSHKSSSKQSRSHSSSRSSKGKSRSGSTSGKSHTPHRRGSEAKLTTDHDEIRRWVEDRGGHPATVRSTVEPGEEAGLLRIDFPGYSGGDSLEEISWDEFFDKFEESKLAFLHQDTTRGKKSRFNKLVSRENQS